MSYTSPTSHITSSGLSFASFQGKGCNGMLETLIANNTSANANPTAAPTVSASGTGNTLPAATYFATVTETDGVGETTNGGQVSSGQAVTLGQGLVVTFQSLKSGNVARNVYVATSNTGPWTLVATGVTASTYTVTAPLPTNSWASLGLPAANTTGLLSDGTPEKTRMLRAAESGNLQDDWNKLRILLRNFNEGKPIAFNELMTRLRNFHLVVAVYDQLCSEVGTLIDANPGTLRVTNNPIGGANLTRQWP